MKHPRRAAPMSVPRTDPPERGSRMLPPLTRAERSEYAKRDDETVRVLTQLLERQARRLTLARHNQMPPPKPDDED